ncbi:MAG: 50S ribosomal protein L30 [bacterium]|nr:50S ribosomal protein L30 [bacterium]
MTNSSNGSKTLRVTLVRSWTGYRADQEAAVRALGLSKLNQTVEKEDTPTNRGLIFKVKHLLKVEEV